MRLRQVLERRTERHGCTGGCSLMPLPCCQRMLRCRHDWQHGAAAREAPCCSGLPEAASELVHLGGNHLLVGLGQVGLQHRRCEATVALMCATTRGNSGTGMCCGARMPVSHISTLH